MPASAPALPEPVAARRSGGFLLLVGLANAGGVIGFLPLLSLLLPMKVDAIAGEARIGLFTATVLAGALTASISNILFGWLSDRSVARGGGRRRWVVFGLGALALSFAAVAAAATPAQIIMAVMLFQAAVNALLAPLFAIMADEVPDAQKGVSGGLLSLGNPIAAGVSALVVSFTLFEGGRLAFVFAAVALCVAPLLATPAVRVAQAAETGREHRMLRRDLLFAWGSRILVQVAGNALSLYLLYYFQSVVAEEGWNGLDARVGQLLTLGYLLPVPLAVLIGRLSDRTGRRKPFLLGSAAVAALGLAGMALAGNWQEGAAGFIVYASGSAVFLALHSGFAMQLLPSAEHRGRNLGLLNLTNTLPALLGPLLTWILATPSDFAPAMLMLAVLTLAGGLAMLGVRGRR